MGTKIWIETEITDLCYIRMQSREEQTVSISFKIYVVKINNPFALKIIN